MLCPGLWAWGLHVGVGLRDTCWVFYLLLICISRFSTAPVPRHLGIRGPFLVTDMTVYRGGAGILAQWTSDATS